MQHHTNLNHCYQVYITVILNVSFSWSSNDWWLIAWAFMVKWTRGDCHRISLITSQQWLRKWFSTFRHQAINWTNAEHILWSPRLKESMFWIFSDSKKYICIFNVFHTETLRNLSEGSILSSYLSQYHGYWWSTDTRSQGISSHSIDKNSIGWCILHGNAWF